MYCVESRGGGLTIDLMPDVTLDDPTIQCDDVGNVDFDDDRASTDDGDVRSDDDDVQGGREVIFTSVAMTRLHLMPSDVVSSFCHTIVHTATSLHTVTGLVENFYTLHAPHGTRYCQL